jgi:glycosyltransferase involved in cell wall biosynthesis
MKLIRQTTVRITLMCLRLLVQPGTANCSHMRVSITIPVYNEESCLADTLNRLHAFLSTRDLGWDWEIVVADNGSTDRTREIAEQFVSKISSHSAFYILNSEFKSHSVRVVALAEKGRGRALKHAWLNTDADVLVYMDADLSTDLDSLPALIGALIQSSPERSEVPIPRGSSSSIPDSVSDTEAASETDGSEKRRGGERGIGRLSGYDLAIGSRLLRNELTTRSLKREFISRCYNRLIRLMFPNITFSDAQCGFKAITREAAQALLPQVEDTNWFFDTELLILAENHGYRIFDLPVRWIERRQTSVKILRTALDDLKGLVRLKRRMAASPRHPHPVATLSSSPLPKH